MLFSRRLSRVLALVLVTSMLATVALAAPSKEQRVEEGQLRTLVKKAGSLYSAGDYEASGKLIADVQVSLRCLQNSEAWLFETRRTLGS